MKTVTGMGGMGGARELAEMLRQMGRGRDTVLAHITPEEAQMLLDQGGAGTINPATGLPEFQDADIQGEENFYGQPMYEYDAEAQEGGFYGNTPNAFYDPIVTETTYRPQFDETGRQIRGIPFAGLNAPPADIDIGFGPGRFAPSYGAADVAGMGADQLSRFAAQPTAPQQPGMLDQFGNKIQAAEAYLQERPGLAKALGFGAQTLVGLLQANRARRQAQEAAGRISKLARPLREQGEALRTQAMAGQLTPQQAASQEARRASLRQAGANRGVTTGTQQAMIENQLARERATLSESNLNQALKLLGVANTADEAAIRAALSGDREVDEILADIIQSGVRTFTGTEKQQDQRQQTQRQLLPKDSLFPLPKVSS